MYQIPRCHIQKTIILVQFHLYLHLWLWVNCSNENLKNTGSKPYPLHIGKYKKPTHIAGKHYTIASLHSGYMWHMQCRVHYNLIIARLKKASNLFTCIYHTRRVIYLSWHRFEWRWKRLVLHQAAPKRDIVLNNRYLGGGLSPVRYHAASPPAQLLHARVPKPTTVQGNLLSSRFIVFSLGRSLQFPTFWLLKPFLVSRSKANQKARWSIKMF